MIVAFEGEATLGRMCDIFSGSGRKVVTATSCAEVLRKAGKLEEAVVLCGFKLRDGPCEAMSYDLPEGMPMVMLAKGDQLADVQNPEITKLTAPIRKSELLAAVDAVLERSRMLRKAALPQRSDADKALILRAKTLLMEQQGLTEEQAHRLLQKRSMDTGMKLVDTARLLLGETAIY